MFFLLLHVIELGFEESEGLGLVLDLALFRLGINNDSRREVSKSYSLVGCIDALTAVTGSSHNIDPYILGIDLDIDILIRFGHYGN